MFQLIYTSSAAENMNNRALRELAKQSVISNSRHNITGMLLTHNGAIMQILEGEEHSVRRLLDNIKLDTRHSQVIVLTQGEREKREFPTWSMGYQDVSTLGNCKALFELTVQSLKKALPMSPSAELDSLTRTFVRVSQLQI